MDHAKPNNLIINRKQCPGTSHQPKKKKKRKEKEEQKQNTKRANKKAQKLGEFIEQKCRK